jgi:hypothetical protein
VHEGVCGEFEQKEEAVGAAEEVCPSCISSVVRTTLTKSEANKGHELVAGLEFKGNTVTLSRHEEIVKSTLSLSETEFSSISTPKQ